MSLPELLAAIDSAGGGITLRPTGANVFAPKPGGGWLRYDAKRNAGETLADLAERALRRAILKWGL